LDWRLQGAGLIVGVVLAGIPFAFGPDLSVGQSAFVTSWNAVVSSMQYILTSGLVLAILGILWRGPIGQRSGKMQVYCSFVLGIWMLWNIYNVGWTRVMLDQDCCQSLIPTVAPAQNLLTIGLLIPTVTLASSLFWLVWDHRHRPRPAFHRTAQAWSLVFSVSLASIIERRDRRPMRLSLESARES
jgi:hypothetical protein